MHYMMEDPEDWLLLVIGCSGGFLLLVFVDKLQICVRKCIRNVSAPTFKQIPDRFPL